MSASHGLHCSTLLGCLVVLLAIAALLAPRTVCAESLLLLYKEDTSKTINLRDTIRQYAKQPAVVSLNQNGDLLVKYGSVNMVLAYNPPEEPYKKQEPVQLAMAVSQDAPPISGLSIRVNFSF